jgi:CRP-like cAMP-binding protein
MPDESELSRKLRFGAALKENDISRLEMLSRNPEAIPANTDLIQEKDVPYHVHLVTAGVVCRYKHLEDGSRSIVALMLPGDFCDLHVTILGRMDHSIGTLVDSRIVRVPGREMEEMLREFPLINRACWWATLVDEAVLREWLVSVGRREAEKHLAHLFCELYTRLDAVGLTQGREFRLPFTQEDLADILQISKVHLQRVLKRLRNTGAVHLQNRHIELADFESLKDFAEFDPGYLHLDKPPDKGRVSAAQ